jgi:hypothetical protein
MTSRIPRWRPRVAAGAVAVALAVGVAVAAASPGAAPAAKPPAAAPPAAGALPAVLQARLAALGLPTTLPAKAPVRTLVKRPPMTSTCPTVRAHLKQDAARGIKTVACMTIGGPAPAFATARSQAATPSVALPPPAPLCGTIVGAWVLNRTGECIYGLNQTSETITTNGQVIGLAFFRWNMSITMSTNDFAVHEADSVTFMGGTTAQANSPSTVTFTPTCESGCNMLTGTYKFVLAPGQTQTNIQVTYNDKPAAGLQDTFATFYTWSVVPQGTFLINSGEWTTDADIRCDNQLSPRGVGCVVPGFIPNLPLSVATYGAAAKNVEYGEDFIPGNPGLLTSNPLTRGDVNATQGNRSAVCDSTFTPITRLVPTDSCDEYPFASSQQSGGQLKLIGFECLNLLPLFVNGSWRPEFVNSFNPELEDVYNGDQLCERGHVPLDQNRAVGNALGSFYTLNRMLAGDPYTVSVTA